MAPGDTGITAALRQAETLVVHWRTDSKAHAADVTAEFADGQEELTKTLQQLLHAGAWSLLLIALMLYLQFGGIAETLTVMTALLFGIMGAALSLFICGSKLSVNSGLGIILLNGLAVANSIMLVDCAKRYLAAGMVPLEAVCAAAGARLRPILITSVTTALGMLPIALGLGDGGSILQPLGIAVAGGLAISALLTVVVVPALHLVWLQAAARHRAREDKAV